MSAIQDINAVSGWRLFLYALLGTWVIGKTGTAVAEIIHGPTDYGAMLTKIVQPDEKQAGTSTPPKVAGIDIGSVASIPEIDSLAANLAATFGPLPPEAMPSEDGTINVGSAKALPWLAGIIAAAVGVAWYVRHRGAVAPLAVKTSPIEVKPVDLNVKPQLPSIPGLNAPASPGAPEPAQQVQQVADLIKTVMQQGQQIAQPKVSGPTDIIDILYVDDNANQWIGTITNGMFRANPAAVFKTIDASLAPGHAYRIGPMRNCNSGECEFDLVADIGPMAMAPFAQDVGASGARYPSARLRQSAMRGAETPLPFTQNGGGYRPTMAEMYGSEYSAGYTQGCAWRKQHPHSTRDDFNKTIKELESAGFSQKFIEGFCAGQAACAGPQ